MCVHFSYFSEIQEIKLLRKKMGYGSKYASNKATYKLNLKEESELTREMNRIDISGTENRIARTTEDLKSTVC